MHNKEKLYHELIDAFIQYQYRLEHPMQSSAETYEMRVMHYHSDLIFKTKVDSLVEGIMVIISKYV